MGHIIPRYKSRVVVFHFRDKLGMAGCPYGGRCGVTVKMLQTAGNLAWLVGYTVLRNEMRGGRLAISTRQ